MSENAECFEEIMEKVEYLNLICVTRHVNEYDDYDRVNGSRCVGEDYAVIPDDDMSDVEMSVFESQDCDGYENLNKLVRFEKPNLAGLIQGFKNYKNVLAFKENLVSSGTNFGRIDVKFSYGDEQIDLWQYDVDKIIEALEKYDQRVNA